MSDSSQSVGLDSIDTPGCVHRWTCITIQPGFILGVDSAGAPIFLEDPDDPGGTAYGCMHCDEPWTAPSPIAEPR